MFKLTKSSLYISLGLLSLLTVSSCHTPKDIVYFQEDANVTNLPAPGAITILPFDRLSIIVNSRDLQVSEMFNLPYVTRQLGTASTNKSYQSQGVSSYTVDDNGDIDFPQLGKVHVGGMTRVEAAALIKGMLIGSDLVKDPTVIIEILNAGVSVLGEVAHPGRVDFERDDMTILDALAAAGDLTIYGERQNVKVLRQEDGVERTYRVNLLSVDSVRTSPVYFLRQEDVVYVEPNNTRIRQSTVNGNTVLSTSFWISIASMAITLAAVIAR